MQLSGPCISSTGTSRSADKAHRHRTVNACIGAGAGTPKVYSAVVGVLQRAQRSAASMHSPLNTLRLRHSASSVEAGMGNGVLDDGTPLFSGFDNPFRILDIIIGASGIFT